MNTLLLKPRSWLLPLILVLFIGGISACIPIIRTEYTSPSWQGTLVDMQTGAPLVNVEVLDLHTLKKVKTDHQGHFQLEPNISQFSLKLPVATMISNYQIEVALPEGPLRFNGTRMANTVVPSDFDLGTLPIATSKATAPFLFEEDGKMVALPEHFIESCGAPLEDAIHLANAARLYRQLVNNGQSLGNKKAGKKDIELSYYWANESWQHIPTVCFKGDYKQSDAFYKLSKLFYQEARQYFTERPIDFGGD